MEMVAIVDRENNLVGAATRREMRERALPHRATYIVIENSRGEFYVQKRTMTKDVYPGYWDPVTGGVVQSGESYEESAVRELEEEMGITGVVLRELFDFWFEDGAKAPVWGRAYHCRWDGATRPQPEEVEYVELMSRERIEARKMEMTPDGYEVMLRYWQYPPHE